jgi:hypothetical protein
MKLDRKCPDRLGSKPNKDKTKDFRDIKGKRYGTFQRKQKFQKVEGAFSANGIL